VNVATYPSRNLGRRKGRTTLTVVAVAVAVLIFAIIRTVVAAWNAGAEEAAKDRLATRHKVSFTMQLPKRYIDDIRQVPGVSAATWANWFGAKDPKQRAPFFAGLAADHETWFDVMDEMKIDPAALEKWKQTANGAILGDVLARTLQVKVGDTLTINSDIYPGDWQFEVVGIYTPLRKTADRNTLLFRWDYLNNDPRGAWSKDQIGWIMTRIEDPKQSAAISKRIDATFDERDDQTLSMSERQFQLSWLGAFGAILTAFDYISIFIGLILLLIVANAIAMSVRERTHEYGVLRAIGFSPGYVGGFILAESVLIGIVGGLVGLLITFLLVNVLIGPLIEQGEMGAFFPYFSVPPKVFLQSLGFAFVIGLLAAVIPALGASRRRVTDALRRLD
jgi:putative ABC transport system permease protein